MHSGIKRTDDLKEVQTFLHRLKYAILEGGARVTIIRDRRVDLEREPRFSNRYTISQLFPDEEDVDAVKRELLSLGVENYIETVKDLRFPKRSDLVVFGKTYGDDDVYVKIRVELTHTGSGWEVLVISFHFAETRFSDSDFPYRS